MTTTKQALRVAVIEINKRWHATPVFDDGTAGRSERFMEAGAAWDWARLIYPAVPVTMQAGRRKRPQSARRRGQGSRTH